MSTLPSVCMVLLYHAGRAARRAGQQLAVTSLHRFHLLLTSPYRLKRGTAVSASEPFEITDRKEARCARLAQLQGRMATLTLAGLTVTGLVRPVKMQRACRRVASAPLSVRSLSQHS
jgi:hypothetical protein